MDSTPVERLTLREMLKESEMICREYADHLERGFAPKSASLSRLLRPEAGAELQLATERRAIHHTAQTVLASDDFSRKLQRRLNDLLKAICDSVSRITQGG